MAKWAWTRDGGLWGDPVLATASGALARRRAVRPPAPRVASGPDRGRLAGAGHGPPRIDVVVGLRCAMRPETPDLVDQLDRRLAADQISPEDHARLVGEASPVLDLAKDADALAGRRLPLFLARRRRNARAPADPVGNAIAGARLVGSVVLAAALVLALAGVFGPIFP